MAVPQGFEPRLDVPKTSVLPLHHRTFTPKVIGLTDALESYGLTNAS
jgi:hypothetical protein